MASHFFILVLLLIMNWVCMWFGWEQYSSVLWILGPYSALVFLIEASFGDIT